MIDLSFPRREQYWVFSKVISVFLMGFWEASPGKEYYGQGKQKEQWKEAIHSNVKSVFICSDLILLSSMIWLVAEEFSVNTSCTSEWWRALMHALSPSLWIRKQNHEQAYIYDHSAVLLLCCPLCQGLGTEGTHLWPGQMRLLGLCLFILGHDLHCLNSYAYIAAEAKHNSCR
jgi:hypothetical protein